MLCYVVFVCCSESYLQLQSPCRSDTDHIHKFDNATACYLWDYYVLTHNYHISSLHWTAHTHNVSLLCIVGGYVGEWYAAYSSHSTHQIHTPSNDGRTWKRPNNKLHWHWQVTLTQMILSLPHKNLTSVDMFGISIQTELLWQRNQMKFEKINSGTIGKDCSSLTLWLEYCTEISIQVFLSWLLHYFCCTKHLLSARKG